MSKHVCAACQFLDVNSVSAVEELTNPYGQRWWACAWHAWVARTIRATRLEATRD